MILFSSQRSAQMRTGAGTLEGLDGEGSISMVQGQHKFFLSHSIPPTSRFVSWLFNCWAIDVSS